MYAEVILPLSLENSYTYVIPADLEKMVSVGCRVIVHFGKKKYYTAIVKDIHDRKPDTPYELKEIYTVLDPVPVIRRPQMRFWEWIASYYLCKQGDVYKAAVPSGLKLESESTVVLKEDFIGDKTIKKNEQSVLDAFGGQSRRTISELEKITGLRNVLPVIAMLLSRGAVEVEEEIKKKFVPKMQTFIRLAPGYRTEEQLEEAFARLKRAPKQETLLISYLDLSHIQNPALTNEVSKKELLMHASSSAAILDNLIKRGILESYEKEISRLNFTYAKKHPLTPLSDAQQKALDAIYDSFKSKDVTLLHGVTSSGKTEVYIHLIQEVLRKGRQVLYLLPEIAITTQITDRLARIFGDQLIVYHSRFSDNERVEIWNKLLHEQGPKLILGVRSSLFLPFRDLGLVIVDEEHENTFKQQDPAPRYHARNAAIVLTNMHGGKVLLGSATPSIDSYYNALTGKYGLVELSARYGECLPPEIIPVNVRELKRKKIIKDTLFSPILIEKITEALEKGEQVILFQNRRGFAPMVECKSCGYIPKCNHCDVSLTYHKYHNQMVCHYCGFKYQVPPTCPDCREGELKTIGFGTEKVEEEIKELIRGAKIGRLDVDSARTRMAYERILNEFENGNTNILIGTQMLSKGLDFGNVSVVGILSADNLMGFPDFRAHERAYQLMAQVSGRAGRRDKRGTVIIQTSQPEHPVIGFVKHSDYKGMVNLQLSERNMFRYPPFYRMIVVTIRSRNQYTLENMSERYAAALRDKLGDRVLGPVTPVVSRIQNLHIKKIILKIEITASIATVRRLLDEINLGMKEESAFRQLLIHYDVDPL